MRRFDVQTTQMSLSVLFVSAGVLFDDTGLEWVNGPVNRIIWEAGGNILVNRECFWKKTQVEKNNNNQAMCNYLQTEQCHSTNLENFLITSREMLSLFVWCYLQNASHSAMLKSGFLV